jgi:hypothetical protein
MDAEAYGLSPGLQHNAHCCKFKPFKLLRRWVIASSNLFWGFLSMARLTAVVGTNPDHALDAIHLWKQHHFFFPLPPRLP